MCWTVSWAHDILSVWWNVSQHPLVCAAFFCRMINVRSGLNSLLADLMQIESDETESIRGRNRSLFWFFIVNTYYIYVSREWRKFAILIHRFSHAKGINVLLILLTVELDCYILIRQYQLQTTSQRFHTIDELISHHLSSLSQEDGKLLQSSAVQTSKSSKITLTGMDKCRMSQSTLS